MSLVYTIEDLAAAGYTEVAPGRFARTHTPVRTEEEKGSNKPKHLQHIKGGKYVVGGQVYNFRSQAEFILAYLFQTYLEAGAIAEWKYECRRFYFEGIKRGVTSYLPDFYILENSGTHWWAECKGWMNQRSKTALNRMAKYFPEEKVVVFNSAYIRAIIKSGIIPKHILEELKRR